MPSPQCVGQEFVRQYYTLLHQAPEHMHRYFLGVDFVIQLHVELLCSDVQSDDDYATGLRKAGIPHEVSY